MYTAKAFTKELNDTIKDTRENFDRLEVERLIKQWQDEVLSAARSNKSSVEVRIYPSVTKDIYIKAAVDFFTSVNVRTQILQKKHECRDVMIDLVCLSW